jgi:hypothetical protein
MAEPETIEKKYEKAFSQLGEVQTIFPVNAKQEMAQMVEQIAFTDTILKDKIINTSWLKGQKGGRAAEEILAESYNLDSILKNKPTRAITDKYDGWKTTGFRKGNDEVVDIAGIGKEGDVIYTAQSKFCASAEESAGSSTGMSQVKDGQPKYGEADALIGPKDQVSPHDGSVSIKEHAEAKAYAEEHTGKIAQAKASQNTAHKVDDRVEFDGVEGKSFKKDEVDEIGSGSRKGKDIRDKYTDEYLTDSTKQHMKQAAVGAAAISAVSSGVFNTVMYCKMAREGKITNDEAVLKIVAETASSAADSAFKASANVGIQTVASRYATKEGLNIIARNSLRTLARTNVVTVGVICGIDVIKDLVRLGTGKIDGKQFEERNGKNVLNTSAAVMGGSVGTALGSSFAGLFGAVKIGALFGGLSGGLIAGLAMHFAIENHIEKPYKELVSNTVALNASMQVFRAVSNDIFEGQIIFQAFLEKDKQLNDDFDTQLERIDSAGNKMSTAIDKI